jgi:CcmD family protein
MIGMDNWTFVAAAYGITALVLVGYVWVLRARLRAVQSEIDQENQEP